jgi:tRNA-dihydrouridine synthase B
MNFAPLLAQAGPILALAPMQDITDLPFWRLMADYGGADLYYTEYFRVHADSKPEKVILRSLVENPTGRPAIAQMIGNDIPSLVRTAKELQQYPIVAVDLNLGCPAPIVYKKCAGGGLLREPQRIDQILGALREAISIRFTVKTRLGFDDPATLDVLLPIFEKHHLDLLTVHGRTVSQMYRNGVDYERIAQAASYLSCPVLANGNINTPEDAAYVWQSTGVRGLMIGRAAIRNPWLFTQIRAHLSGQPITLPTGQQVAAYIRQLYEAVCAPDVSESAQVQKMKKYLGFIGEGIEPTGQFLYEIRRVSTKADFFRVVAHYLTHDEPMPLAPFPVAK